MRLHVIGMIGLAACGGSSAESIPDAAPASDAAPGIAYDCGEFSEDSGWTVTEGFRAVVVADADDGLSQPVAAAFASGAYGGRLYVVNQGAANVLAVDTNSGAAEVFTATWPEAPGLLTTVVWDEGERFDGAVYVGDQGGDGDGDSKIYRLLADGSAEVFARPPGAGLDDIYAMVFSPAGYPDGLLVAGDTDGAGVDWGVVSASGETADFSEVNGIEGAAVDLAGSYGGGLFASRPAGGGYGGTDTIDRIAADGTVGATLAMALPGVHAISFPPAGPFGGQLHAASWQDGTLYAVAPDATVTTLASGLTLTNYDGNILAFSPDGNVLLVADRLANRLLCIEPV